MNREEINSLWRNELSAIEAYQQTLGAKEWKLSEGDPEVDELFRILVDHVQAASLLGTKIRRLDVIRAADELEAPGKWSELGTLAGGLFRDAHVFSDKARLKVLKQGEECSLENYEHMLQETATPRTLKPLINKLANKQRAHIRALSVMSKDPSFRVSLRRSNDEVEARSDRSRRSSPVRFRPSVTRSSKNRPNSQPMNGYKAGTPSSLRVRKGD